MKQGRGDFSIGSDVWPGLSKLIEEAGETLQVAGKLIGSHGAPDHWDGTDLVERLEKELADLQAAIWFVVDNCPLDKQKIADRSWAKLRKFTEWQGAEALPA